jgi:hypothetical protein
MRVTPVSDTRTFKFPTWTGVIVLDHLWYAWPELRHVFIVMVDTAIVAIACDPKYFIMLWMIPKMLA